MISSSVIRRRPPVTLNLGDWIRTPDGLVQVDMIANFLDGARAFYYKENHDRASISVRGLVPERITPVIIRRRKNPLK